MRVVWDGVRTVTGHNTKTSIVRGEWKKQTNWTSSSTVQPLHKPPTLIAALSLPSLNAPPLLLPPCQSQPHSFSFHRTRTAPCPPCPQRAEWLPTAGTHITPYEDSGEALPQPPQGSGTTCSLHLTVFSPSFLSSQTPAGQAGWPPFLSLVLPEVSSC